MSLFEWGVYRLHSGGLSNWKIECDSLTQSDWETLAFLISERAGKFSGARGVPRGGIPLALALTKYADRQDTSPLLIVDDVATTGDSILEFGSSQKPALVPPVYWTVFWRGEVPQPPWLNALFSFFDTPRAGLIGGDTGE